jgi:hypothetical protein
MARPTKLTPELQQRIGDNIALGLTDSLSAEAAGITYKTFNEYMNRDIQRNLGNIIDFISTFKNAMLMPQKFFWNA